MKLPSPGDVSAFLETVLSMFNNQILPLKCRSSAVQIAR